MTTTQDWLLGLIMETDDALDGILDATEGADNWFWNFAEGFNGRMANGYLRGSLEDSGAHWDDKRLTWVFPDGSFGRMEPSPTDDTVFRAGIQG